MVASEGFTFEFYRRLMQFALENFDIRTFGNHDKKSKKDLPILLIRHDIDVSLRRALELACLEKELGISSTYMIMANSLLYNLEKEKEKILTIQRFGHEIGLHFENPDIDLVKLNASCKKLEGIIGRRVASFSIHRRYLLEQKISDRVITCGPPLLKNYFSDSRGIFNLEHFEKILVNRHDNITQWLFHPIWWGNEKSSEINLGIHIQKQFSYHFLENQIIPYIRSLIQTLPKFFGKSHA